MLKKTGEFFAKQKSLGNVPFFIDKKDNTIVTFTPKYKNYIVFFYPKEPILIQSFKRGNVVNYHANFKKIEVVNQQPRFVFTITKVEVFKNDRTEMRKQVEISALFNSFEHIGQATIVDISKNGAKIYTKFLIQNEVIELHFDEGKQTNVHSGTIKWAKKTKTGYLYGIEFHRKDFYKERT